MELTITEDLIKELEILIGYEIQRFVEFTDLMTTKKMSHKYFYNVLRKAKMLRLKEKNIVNNLENADEAYAYLKYLGPKTLLKCGLSELESDIIYKRLSFILAQRCIYDRMEHQINFDLDEDYDYYDTIEENIMFEFDIDPEIEAQVWLNYLKEINNTEDEEFIKRVKYLLCFENPIIDDELATVEYNIEDLLDFDNETIAQSIYYEKEAYEEEVLYAYQKNTNEYLNLFLMQISDPNEDEKNIEITLSKLKYFLNNVDDETIIMIAENNFGDDPTIATIQKFVTQTKEFMDFFKQKYQAINKEIASYEEENYPAIPLDPQIIDLIKLENNIYDIITKLTQLEIDGKNESEEYKTNIEILKQYRSEEFEITNNMRVDFDTFFEICELINNDSDIILGNYTKEEDIYKNDLIKSRIENLFPSLQRLENIMYRSDAVSNVITKNYLLQVFAQYDEYISQIENKTPYVTTKYNELFASGNCLDELFENNGDFTNSHIINDNLSEILNMSEEEYQFDKNYKLYSYANFVIDSLSTAQILTEEDQAEAKFQDICFNIAVEQLDDESVVYLFANYKKFKYENSSIAYKNLREAFKKNSKKAVKKRH